MASREVCVFNQTRQSFLSLDTKVAASQFQRLKGLLGRRELKSDEGLWLVPCQGIHTIGLLFPIDVIYLDANNRVVHLIEHLKPFRITSFRRKCHSVLELPIRTIFESETEVDDQLTLNSISELEDSFGAARAVEAELEDAGRNIAIRSTLSPVTGPPEARSTPHTTLRSVVRQETGRRWGKSGYLYSTEPDGRF